MLLAAECGQKRGKLAKPTADAKALDGDVILSAQARLLCDVTTEVIVATTNVAHLSRFITAMDWQSIS